MNARTRQDFDSYNDIKSRAIAAFKDGELERSLDYTYIAVSYAWGIHFGKWYDEELEDLLSEIGLNIRSEYTLTKTSKKKDGKRIAHIASFLSDIGGHPEVLKQWIGLLSENIGEQTLYITSVPNVPSVYPYLKNFLQSKGVEVHELSYNHRYIERIKELIRLLTQESPDFLILYIHPNDVVVVPALCALSSKPPTIFFNHADHVFWLGRNIIDYLIEWREEGAKYSKKFRKINRSYVIPLTTDIKPQKVPKESFGIPENSTLSISIGSFYKVLGDPELDYFRTIEGILKQFPNHYHMLVTTSPSIVKNHLTSDKDIRRRFIITGPIAKVEPVYGVADLLIETFPIAGGMVRVEAMACKLPIVAFHNRKSPLFSETDALPADYPFVAFTKDEIVEYSSKLLENPMLRKNVGEELYSRYKQKMSPEKVGNLLHDIIRGNEHISSSMIEAQGSEKEPEYDLEYVRRRDSFAINEKLLIQAALKRSSFSFEDRIKFYIKALKNKEFQSRKRIVRGAVLALGGWWGPSLYELLGRKINRRRFL